MRILFHFPTSPFARRIRLALAHKGLAFDLRDVRANTQHRDEAHRLSPLKTIPVFVDEDGGVLGDSTAISHYLDRVYPSTPPLWPPGPEEALLLFDVASLVDVALDGMVDYGIRNYPLHNDPAWEGVKGEAMDRVQRALDTLAQRVTALTRPTFSRVGWSAADMWLYTAERWFSALPARAATIAPAAQVVSLGLRMPPEISRWADQHQDRPDVRALD